MTTVVHRPAVYRIVDGVMERIIDVDPPVTRDAMKWPYPSDSLWNMPIGQQADLIPIGFDYGSGDGPFQNGRIAIAEDNILFLDADAPLAYIMETDAGWSGASRCGSRTGNVLRGNNSLNGIDPGGEPTPQVPIPEGWDTSNYIGSTPNMSGAVVFRDGDDIKLLETQPLHLCPDGVAVSQFINIDWYGDSIYTGGDGVKGGSHGGGYITAFGGTIRLGELVPGGEIPHALKFTWDTGWWCGDNPTQDSCFRWPALRADSGAVNNYGTLNTLSTPPLDSRMGGLYTVPSSFDTEQFTLEPARIIARAIQRYGMYLCDGDFNAPTRWNVTWQLEWSNEGRVVDEFRNAWGFEFFHRPSQHGTADDTDMTWRQEIATIMEAIHVVADNAPDNVGGAGVRRWTTAPPLAS